MVELIIELRGRNEVGAMGLKEFSIWREKKVEYQEKKEIDGLCEVG